MNNTTTMNNTTNGTIFVFRDLADVNNFFVISLIVLSQFYAGIVSSGLYKENAEWYDSVTKRIAKNSCCQWFPPRWIFPLVWSILYILITVAMVTYYRTVAFMAGEVNYEVLAVTFLFFFNIIANKYWPTVFFVYKQTIVSALLTVFMIATSIPILYIFSNSIHLGMPWNIPFWSFLWYPIWCVIALIINFMWYRNDKKKESSKKPRKSDMI